MRTTPFKKREEEAEMLLFTGITLSILYKICPKAVEDEDEQFWNSIA